MNFSISISFQLRTFVPLRNYTMSSGKRKHKCAGCRQPVKDHFWGKPGKHCDGRPVSDDDADQFPLSVSPRQHNDISSDSKSHIADDFVSLTSDLQALHQKKKFLEARLEKTRLEAEVAKLEREFDHSASVESTATGIHHHPRQHSHSASGNFSLGDLRKMTHLREEVEEELAPLASMVGVDRTVGDEQHNAGEWRFDHFGRTIPHATAMKTKDRQFTNSPEHYIASFYTSNELKYDDLTLEQFLQGYTLLLQNPSLSVTERNGRLQLLHDIFVKLPQYKWQVVRSYHAAVIRLVESHRRSWLDSFAVVKEVFFDFSPDKLKSQPVARNKGSAATNSSNNNISVCTAFNETGSCSFDPCKYRHICNYCFTYRNRFNAHSELHCKQKPGTDSKIKKGKDMSTSA